MKPLNRIQELQNNKIVRDTFSSNYLYVYLPLFELVSSSKSSTPFSVTVNFVSE